MTRARGFASLAAAALVVFLLAACGGGGQSAATKDVSVFGLFLDDDASSFARSMEPFEDETGIDVRYVGTANLEADLQNRLDEGTRPDVAFVAQPGLVAQLARDGDIEPMPPEVAELVSANFAPELVDLATVDGELYAVPWVVDVKSLVWYPPRAFDAAGYEVPTTLDELIDLTDRIAADGTSPWCVGMADYSSTGWVATDWVEDLLIRTAGPEVYDDWVAHEIPFDSDDVVAALQQFGDIARNSDRILGQPDAWLTTPVSIAPRPLVDSPPGCLLHKQASFAERYFRPGTDISPDGDLWFFPFPGVDDGEQAVLVGGQMAVMLDDTAQARSLLAYLATPESTELWAEEGGIVPAHTAADLQSYGRVLDSALVDLVLRADVLRFDGSDLMVPAVGTGTFWTGMVDYIAGKAEADVLAEIEESWPSS